MRLGAIFAFLGVGLGAFGAHALPLAPRWLDVWRTGVQYHLAHALALVLVGALAERFARPERLALVARLFAAGIVLFGGSLYALALSSLLGSGPVLWLGAITPLGGVCFLVGWALLAVAASGKSTA